MSVTKRIAIIGAGSSGITAAKCCLEENLQPVVFEKTNDMGGLWRYHEEDVNGLPSVMKSTIINTSKEKSAYSDFPPPKEYPNYMHNSFMFKYFCAYAEKFGIPQYIRYRHEVVKVVPSASYEDDGRWDVTFKSLESGETRTETFEGVLVCIGHHVYPHVPTFAGQEKFKGNIVHTHSLKVPDRFKDRRVVVVGIGNSGVDAAVECSTVTPNVYLSTRRGAWIIRRVGEKGVPSDFSITRFNGLFLNLLGFQKACDYLEKASNEVFDHEAYGLKPKHRILSQHPTVTDELPNRILSGTVTVKGDIREFTENGIIFKGDDHVTPVDDVILATGYQIRFPFLPEDIVAVKNNKVVLYKFGFPPHLKHPTLEIIGLYQPTGPIFPIAELQCRWFAQLMVGNCKLPSKEEMLADGKKKNEANAKRYVESPRHTIQVDPLPFMDEIAEQFGAKPKLKKLFFTDQELFWACFRGPFVPYQYRLNGPHPWPGAREAILSVQERSQYPMAKNRNSTKMLSGGKSSFCTSVVLYLYFGLIASIVSYLVLTRE